MKRSKGLLTLFGTYSAVLLLAALIGISVLISKKALPSTVITETIVETEYVYVIADPYNTSSSSEISSTAEQVWIVREYEGKIGIFTENDNLVKIIDVYTKTLPETDRRLLKEGIKITSEKALMALIEDYSS